MLDCCNTLHDRTAYVTPKVKCRTHDVLPDSSKLVIAVVSDLAEGTTAVAAAAADVRMFRREMGAGTGSELSASFDSDR